MKVLWAGLEKYFLRKGRIKREKGVLRRVEIWTLGRVEERRLGWSLGEREKWERDRGIFGLCMESNDILNI